MAKRRMVALGIVALAVALASCGPKDEPDAYGNFETTEVVVSAQTGGPLLRFEPDEGDRFAAGATVGLVDTTQLALELEQLEAQRAAAREQTGHAGAQVGALEAQLRTARTELGRIERLYAQQAATSQQLDQARGQVRVLEEQIRGASRQTAGTTKQTEALAAQVAQLRDRIARSHVKNPLSGTVLTSYVEAGEYVQPGEPLYKIASLDTLVLRAYVTEPQLSRLRIGQRVQVRVDRGKDAMLTLPGTLTWISSKAEFTPTPIQTRDERADLVYAIKVSVPNASGALKIGMPGEVEFTGARRG